MVRSVEQRFENIKFPPSVLREVRKLLQKYTSETEALSLFLSSVNAGTRTYNFNDSRDDEAQFFDYYANAINGANLIWRTSDHRLEFKIQYLKFDSSSQTRIEIMLSSLAEIHEVLELLEKHEEESRESFPEPKCEAESPVIFLGHGRSPAWRDLQDHLRDKHGYNVEAYETGARAGHTIRDIVEEMANKSDMAFLLHTAEDEQKDGSFQTRPNVIHETGLFQGKLGFSRAIVLLESGCGEFSNLSGIQQIRFSKGNIRETFGDVLATLRREFGEDQK